MTANCKIYTTIEYVKILLDWAGYVRNLQGKRILENSCGPGNILSEVVVRYILDGKKHGLDIVDIRMGLERDIIGIDNDSMACKQCRDRLTNIANSFGIENVKFNIVEGNALNLDCRGISFVVGNPPYVTYHDIPKNEQMFLREHFSVCKSGRFDYCYAFIEQGLNSLKSAGKMAYLLPNSVLKNVWAENLRNYMQPYIRRIIDLKQQKTFENDVTVSSIILVLEKRASNKKVHYDCPIDDVHFICGHKDLTHKWFFTETKEALPVLRFGDYFQVANSVATLYNRAFLIIDYENVDEKHIRVGNFLLEKDILRPAVSPRSCRQKKEYYIIFPYYEDNNGKILHYNMDEFERLYPGIAKYLRNFASNLEMRKAESKAKWFEYGRSQAICHINHEKLIMPMVITKRNMVYEVSKESVPFAGYYIRRIDGYSLSVAKKILESQPFLQYVKEHGTPTSHDSYRISAKEINDYCFEKVFLAEGRK